jgi:hypothetical protein
MDNTVRAIVVSSLVRVDCSCTCDARYLSIALSENINGGTGISHGHGALEAVWGYGDVSVPITTNYVKHEVMRPWAIHDIFRSENDLIAFRWAAIIVNARSRGFHPDSSGKIGAIFVNTREREAGSQLELTVESSLRS